MDYLPAKYTHMRCLKAIQILLWVFFGCFSSPADAQINLKTGYNLSIPSPDALNQLISTYNDSRGYATGFKNVRWLHGFEAGLRLKADLHAFELTYQAAYQGSRAITSILGQEITDRLQFAIHSAAIGYQVSDRIFGAGTDLQYQFYKTKFTAGENGNNFKNIQNMLGLRFYLMFTLKGRQGVDMALKPYYVLPFKEYDISPLAQYLQLEPSDTKERWNRFGLTVLFYNGRK